MSSGFTNSQPRSHPSLLNAASLPIHIAAGNPPPQRASFAEKYPSQFPRGYKMLGPLDESGTLSYLEEYLPIGFYTNPPSNALAKFSTAHGERQFRKMEHILPRRRIHLWGKDQLQAACNSTRKTYWADMKRMTRPSCWDDLWMYYDAFDLYHYGALNLWNLINHLFDENVLIYDGMERECANNIGQWADEWIGLDQNQRKLKEWSEGNKGPITSILSEQDWTNMGDIPEDMFALVSSALKARRSLLLTGVENFRKNRMGASDVMEACVNRNFHNWLAGERVFQENALPSPPPAVEHQNSSCPKDAPPPCFKEGGRHYYLYEVTERPNFRRVSHSAVLELQKSSAAAVKTTTRCSRDVGAKPIIVSGTDELPSSDVQTSHAEAQTQSQPQGQVASNQLVKASADGRDKPVVDARQQSDVQNKNKNQEEEEEEEGRGSEQFQRPRTSARTDQEIAPIVVTSSHTSPSPLSQENRVVDKVAPIVVTSSRTSLSPLSQENRVVVKPESNENMMAATITPPDQQLGPIHSQQVKKTSLSGQTGSTGIPNCSPMPAPNRPATASGKPAYISGNTLPPSHAQNDTQNPGLQLPKLEHKEHKPVQAPATAPTSVPIRAPATSSNLSSPRPSIVSGQIINSIGNDLPARPAFLGSPSDLRGHSPQRGPGRSNASDDIGAQKSVSHIASNQAQTRWISEKSSRSTETLPPHSLPQRPPPATANLDIPSSGAQPEQMILNTTPSFCDNTMVLSSGGGRISTGHRGGHRFRGRQDVHQNQRNFNNAGHYPPRNRQPVIGPEAAEPVQCHGRHWRRNDTLPNVNTRYHSNPRCNNSGTDPYEYNDCGCGDCSGKNKSVWVRVRNRDFDNNDILARLKFGLGTHFGDVDDVIPVPHRTGSAFIVRFQSEDSVAEALGMEHLHIPGTNLSISIEPTHRSKWIVKTYSGVEQSKRQNFEPRHHHHLQQPQQFQPQQHQQYPFMPPPQFNSGMYSGVAGCGSMPFAPREPQQMRPFNQQAMPPPHPNYPYPPRVPPVPHPQYRGPDTSYGPNCGPQYMGGQQQQLPVWQLVLGQQGFHHESGQALVSQSEKTAALKPQCIDSEACKSQSKPSFEEMLKNKELSGQHPPPQQQQQQKQGAASPQRQQASSQVSNHGARVFLPSATLPKVTDEESRGKEGPVSASVIAATTPTGNVEQLSTALGEGKDHSAALDVDTAAKGTDTVEIDRESATCAQISDTCALAASTVVDEHSSAITSTSADNKDGKVSEQASDGTAALENEVSKTPVKDETSTAVGNSAESAARGPFLDSTPSNACTLALPSQSDTVPMSVSPGASSSKAMSASSTPRTSSPHQAYTKTPFNSEARDSNSGKHHHLSSRSPSSPTPTNNKSGTGMASKENKDGQQKHDQTNESPHVLNAAARRFEFPNQGRGTVRLRRKTTKASVLDDTKSPQDTGMTTVNELRNQDQQPVPATDATGLQKQCASKAGAESETKSNVQAVPPGKETGQTVSRPLQVVLVNSGEESGGSVPGGKALDTKASVASSLKVPRKRRRHAKKTSLSAQESCSDRRDGCDKSRQASPINAGGRRAVSGAAPASSSAGKKNSMVQSDSISRSHSSPDSVGASQASQAGDAKRSSENDKPKFPIAECARDTSKEITASKDAGSKAEEAQGIETWSPSASMPGTPDSGSARKDTTLRKSTSSSVLDEKAWPSLPSSGAASPRKKCT
ncbi:hypothetical protein E4U58_002495 [Claviceps cyperi]|nr:hypothetical protein E4U58_002495 [Claviceps cyperi]